MGKSLKAFEPGTFGCSTIFAIAGTMLFAAMLFFTVGCNQPDPDRFAGFASEQVSEQIEIVSAKLDASIDDNQRSQLEILGAVRELTETVAGMQLTSKQQIEELKKVSGKAKAKLTSTSDGKEGVGTLDTENAPSSKLSLDSLDEAAELIEKLQKQVAALDERCQCGKLNATSAPKSNYQAVSSTVSYGSSGVSASGAGSTGSKTFAASSVSYGSSGTAAATPVYSQVTYSQPVYEQPIYSPPVPMPPVSSPVPVSSTYSCFDQYGNPVPCNQSSQPATSSKQRWYFGKNLGW